MLVIAVVALIVIGPERLPKVARTLGHLFGRMQRYVNDVKADISREMELDELRKLQTQIQDAAHSFETSVKKEVSTTESQFQAIAQEANPLNPGAASSPAAEAEAASFPPADPASGPLAPAEMHPTGRLLPEEANASGQLALAELDTPREAAASETNIPGQLTPAEARAQLSLDLTASPVPADKAV